MLTGLQTVLASAEQPIVATRRQHYRAARDDAGIAVTQEGDLLAVVTSPEAARDAIYERAHQRAFELADLRGWLMLRAALVDIDGRRLLLVGPSGVGKTTLTVRLGLRGASIQGDDSVLMRGGQLVAVPRPLTLQDDAREGLPELAAILPGLPRAAGLTLLDPARDLGVPWRLRVAPVDHVVVLEPGHGAPQWRPCPTLEILPILAARISGAAEPPGDLLRALVSTLGSARCHRLGVGEPGATEDALRRLSC